MKFPLLLFILSAFFVVQSTTAQDSLGVENEVGSIRLSIAIEPNRVPVNRTAKLTIRLEWTGERDQYEIRPFDNPIVHNFDIIANASANKVANVNGQTTTIREYTFTLQPTTMGMAYVENFIIKYTDLDTDKEFTLTTNRVEVKVLEPLPEPGSKTWILWVLLVMCMAGGGVTGFFTYRRKREERLKKLREEAEKNIPIEETYLAELKTIPINDPDIDIVDCFSKLSKLLRHFIKDKFSLPGLEASTDELVSELRKLNVDEKFIHETQEILESSDVVKFSGGSSSKAELDRAYTLFEANLHKSLRGELTGNADSGNNEQLTGNGGQ
jgi:hypothetical protein